MFFKYFLILISFLSLLQADDFNNLIAPIFKSHCIECHGGKKIKGKLDLTKLQSSIDLKTDLEKLRDMIDVIDFGEMPPEDEPQPNPQQKQDLLAALNKVLDKSLSQGKVFAQSPVRRMNRFQYNNAIKDLFQLNRYIYSLPEKIMKEHGKGHFDPASGVMPEKVRVGSRPLGKSQMIEPIFKGVGPFPQDLRAEHGYDNRGTHLSLSPFLLEAFLNLAKNIVHNDNFQQGNVGVWNKMFLDLKPGENLDQTLEARLKPFLRKAFRRPVEANTLSRYIDFAKSKLEVGHSIADTIKDVCVAVISSPKFIYLYDQANETPGVSQLNDFDLASRLSFFLWGSIPDDTLLDLAESKQLHQPEILSEQIERMINDKKLKRFADSFPTQWLQLENIISSIPHKKKFPFFYSSRYRASMHMMLEPLLLFETVLIENRSIVDLIDPDFTYKSSVLESWNRDKGPKGKGIGKSKFQVTGLDFKRMPITDRRDGGIVTNTAIMTMTSDAEETHPITRGAWITTVIFNNPPPPPPADVPPLPKKPVPGEENFTLRERLTAHRERADCAGCHEKIDTLGFALENFDAVGLWRDTYPNGRKVDMEGTIFRKHSFENIYEFKDALVAEKDRFAKGLAGHLLSFALARELNAADTPSVTAIAEQTIKKGYKLREMIKEVILSESFHMKNTSKTLAFNSTQP